MSDARAAVIEWLRFAGELGIEWLPAPPGTGASARARTAALAPAEAREAVGARAVSGPVAAVTVPAVPAPGGAAGAAAGAAAGSNGAREGLDRLRRKFVPGGMTGGPRPAASAVAVTTVPAAAASQTPARSVAAGSMSAGSGPAGSGPAGSGPAEVASALSATGSGASTVGPGRITGILESLLGRPGAAISDLAGVRAELGECTRCKLCQGRTHIVFGTGSPSAELMFVGEGPGRDEDLQGEPFVGRAGQLLNDIIKAIGRSREEVYIANVVKCRPPENRTPEADEIAACRGFLFQQIAAVRPRIVVALGKPSLETLLGGPRSITAERGRSFEFFGGILIPTFHPAYLLRTPAKKREVWEDMKRVRDLLALPCPGSEP